MPSAPQAGRFAVVGFDRVFDTVPRQEVVSLDELAQGLLRFELKPEVVRNRERELRRIDEARQRWERGEAWAGRRTQRLRRAAEGAERAGEGVEQAVAAELERMRKEAWERVKTELRLWSPALYRPGVTRGSEGVVSLSCLVLDYDDGVPMEWACAEWEAWFFVVHSTWKHSPDRPRFRICLPLAAPVPAAHWRPFWDWGYEQAGRTNDVALRSPGSTYALPAVGGLSQPREGWVNEGPLLDPAQEAGVPTDPVPEALIRCTGISHFRGGAPDREYVELPWRRPDDDAFDVEGAFDDLF